MVIFVVVDVAGVDNDVASVHETGTVPSRTLAKSFHRCDKATLVCAHNCLKH